MSLIIKSSFLDSTTFRLMSDVYCRRRVNTFYHLKQRQTRNKILFKNNLTTTRQYLRMTRYVQLCQLFKFVLFDSSSKEMMQQVMVDHLHLFFIRNITSTIFHCLHSYYTLYTPCKLYKRVRGVRVVVRILAQHLQKYVQFSLQHLSYKILPREASRLLCTKTRITQDTNKVFYYQ